VDRVDRRDCRVDKGDDAGSSRMMVMDMNLALIVTVCESTRVDKRGSASEKS